MAHLGTATVEIPLYVRSGDEYIEVGRIVRDVALTAAPAES